MFPQTELTNILPYYFTEKNIIEATGDLYAQPTKSPNTLWVLRTGQTIKKRKREKNPLFSPVLFSIVSKPSHQKHPLERRQRPEAQQAQLTEHHGEAQACALQQSRSPGNNKQPTVNSLRL